MLGLLTALGFLTVIPVPSRQEVAPGELGRATIWFPLVGLLVGLMLAGLDWCGRTLWDPSVASGLIIAGSLLLTGGLHLDGFMDSADAFFSHRDRAGMLAVMKDSRAGALGAAAAVALLLIKFAAYARLAGLAHWRLIAAVPMLGRVGMVLALACFPYAREEGTGAGFAAGTRVRHAAAAGIIALAAAFGLLHVQGLALAGGAAVAALLCGVYWLRRLGGLTGDIYGAINEVVELVVVLGGSSALAR